jgi:hypothetical protein
VSLPRRYRRAIGGPLPFPASALSGGIVAWGRRPWRAVRFARLFAET